MPLRSASSDPASGPSTIKAVDHASASSTVGRDNSDRRKAVVDRASGSRVDNVGVDQTINLEEVAVIARRCHSARPNIDHAMDRSRSDYGPLYAYPPCGLPRCAAIGARMSPPISIKKRSAPTSAR